MQRSRRAVRLVEPPRFAEFRIEPAGQSHNAAFLFGGMMPKSQLVSIDSIDRSGRYRKDIGELFSLVKSIEKIGLLHPIVITKDKKLVAGDRRIAAYERLGRTEIEAIIVDGFDEATLLLRAEQDENTCRKDFTPSEAAAMGMALEPLAKAKAKERQLDGASRGGKVSRGVKVPENLRNLNGQETREQIGAAVGMSGPTYQRAKAVVVAAKEDPETFGPIAEEMDRTGSVLGAFNKVVEIKKSGTRSEPVPTEKPSNGRTPVGVLRANEAIDCLKRIPKNDPHRKRGFQIVTDWIKHNR